ncbi:vacuolar carboxypeptidase-like protein Cps1 [Pyrenochaeta sp. DS3sAY3a]|nr:vacuolar carboxypeptidase-like protein Cps1 [Pyrenochaeta sp. DS3sAY3a]
MTEDYKKQPSMALQEGTANGRRKQFLCFIIPGLVLVASCFVLQIILTDVSVLHWKLEQSPGPSMPKCPQVKPLFPSKSTEDLDQMMDFLQSEDFKSTAVQLLSGAVKIPTETFENMGKIGEDRRWDVFYTFADYLFEKFPRTHANLQLEKINTHALLFTWTGTDSSLRPLLLMAHTDVVPVPPSTESEWTYPAFSGHIDDKFVWGRGASDCKNQLLAILSAVEALISAQFVPQRTIILSFGFDEEISGRHGAQQLSKHLLSQYGQSSIAAIIDEGAVNMKGWGASFALPGVVEKGYMDVDILVRTPGGHSSMPPEHSSIGIAAELITLIEGNPHEPHLSEDNPFLKILQCGSEYAPKFPTTLKRLLDKPLGSVEIEEAGRDEVATEIAKLIPGAKYFFTSSLAIDIIHGGVKNNALPEATRFTINFRINVGSSSAMIKRHLSTIAERVTRKHKLDLHAFSGFDTPSSITLSVQHEILEPAPISPIILHSATGQTTPFNVLSGTTRALYGETLYIAPSIIPGNTDTKYYWNLTDHIFRYAPGWDKLQFGPGNIHTVNEKISIEAHIDTIRWMVTWIRNMDEAVL